MKTFSRFLKVTVWLTLLGMISACTSARPVAENQKVVETITIKDPGSEEYVWEPPMVDQVEVPPGLDPEGHYYRPSHEEVVEIRQGRWVKKEPKDYQKEE